MKNIKKISALLLGIAFMLGSTVFASTGTITTDGLRMRKEASKDSDIVTSLNNGAQVEIVEKVGEWYKVKYYDEYEGYLFGEYVKVEGEETTKVEESKPEETKPIETTAPSEEKTTDMPEEKKETIPSETVKTVYPIETITKSSVKIYMIPLITSTKIAEIEKDTKITVQKELNNWVFIKTETVSGWIRKYNLNMDDAKTVASTSTEKAADKKTPEKTPTEEKKIEQKPEEKTNEQEAKISKGYVNVSAARIRDKASTDSNILEVLTLNTEVKVISETGEWYKISFNDITGYVSKTLISETATQTSRGSVTRQPDIETKQEETAEVPKEENTLQKTEKLEKKNEEEVSTEVVKTEKTEKTEEVKTEEPKTISSEGGTKVVTFAKQYLNYKYVYGGTTPSGGFDCSGFTHYVYNTCGYSLSRLCSVQAKSGRAVNKSELKEGDLVFFNNTSDGSIGHVGIYIGNGNFIHAANPSRGVVIDTMNSGYYNTYYYSARRVI